MHVFVLHELLHSLTLPLNKDWINTVHPKQTLNDIAAFSCNIIDIEIESIQNQYNALPTLGWANGPTETGLRPTGPKDQQSGLGLEFFLIWVSVRSGLKTDHFAYLDRTYRTEHIRSRSWFLGNFGLGLGRSGPVFNRWSALAYIVRSPNGSAKILEIPKFS